MTQKDEVGSGCLVFVTPELHPFTTGALGRGMCDVLTALSPQDRARSIALLVDIEADPDVFREMFPDVRWIYVNTEAADAGCAVPKEAYTDTIWHWRSAVVLEEVRRLSAAVQIDYLEFPERFGLGFCVIQERLLTNFLDCATFAVRLHATHPALTQSEARPMRLEDLNLFDLERKCLRDCDVIIAPDAKASEGMRQILGLAPEEWNRRIVSSTARVAKSVEPSVLASAGKPLVSVIIPHFNLGSYLGETIGNIRQQTYQNIEIIVVDDASTDATSVGVLDDLMRWQTEHFKIIRLPGNRGVSAVRNAGIAAAKGQYILPVDADDLLDPDFVSVSVRALENRPEFDVVVSPVAFFADGAVDTVRDASKRIVGHTVFSGEAWMGGIFENRFSTATALIRKKIYDHIKYNENLRCYEDWDLYIKMCEAGARFIVANDVFFYYRQRRHSLNHKAKSAETQKMEYVALVNANLVTDARVRARYDALISFRAVTAKGRLALILPFPVFAGLRKMARIWRRIRAFAKG